MGRYTPKFLLWKNPGKCSSIKSIKGSVIDSHTTLVEQERGYRRQDNHLRNDPLEAVQVKQDRAFGK